MSDRKVDGKMLTDIDRVVTSFRAAIALGFRQRVQELAAKMVKGEIPVRHVEGDSYFTTAANQVMITGECGVTAVALSIGLRNLGYQTVLYSNNRHYYVGVTSNGVTVYVDALFNLNSPSLSHADVYGAGEKFPPFVIDDQEYLRDILIDDCLGMYVISNWLQAHFQHTDLVYSMSCDRLSPIEITSQVINRVIGRQVDTQFGLDDFMSHGY